VFKDDPRFEPAALGKQIPFSLEQLAEACIYHERLMSGVPRVYDPSVGKEVVPGLIIYMDGDQSHHPVIISLNGREPAGDPDDTYSLRAECIVATGDPDVSVMTISVENIREFFRYAGYGSPETYLVELRINRESALSDRRFNA